MSVALLRSEGAPLIRVGHRGARGHAPENTFASFERALQLGVDVIELDVHICRDGEVVVIHDHTVDRTTNGKGYVKDLTLSELMALDAGAWFDSRFIGLHIPTLTQVLAWASDRDVPLAIEIKNAPIYYPGIAEKTVHLLRQYDMDRRAILISFDHLVLREIKMIAPEVAVGILYAARLVDPVAAARAAGADALHPHWAYVTPDLVQMAHEAGLAVSPWVGNDLPTLQLLDQMGVDSVGSDYPDLFAQL